MFFLLRAMFWLAILFAALPWPDDVRPPTRAQSAPKPQDIFAKALEQARAGVERACLDAPAACAEAAADASRLLASDKRQDLDKRQDGRAKPALDGRTVRP